MQQTREQGYETPVVRDFGDLLEITAGTAFTDFEDGSNKQVLHHTGPFRP